MFNGIIKNTGIIKKIHKKNNNCVLVVLSKLKFFRSEIGSSISCSGACLTLEDINNNLITFYVSKETLKRTTFRYLKKGDIINLERSLQYGQRVSGHFVQGHIDTTASISKIVTIGKSWLISFTLPKQYKKFLVQKGSITINGVSLTISKILKKGFQIAVIPKTLELTNLIYLNVEDIVNVELDILSKYIKNFIKK